MALDTGHGNEKNYLNFLHKFGEDFHKGVGGQLVNDSHRYVFGLIYSILKDKEVEPD